jgi:hypothetical protein
MIFSGRLRIVGKAFLQLGIRPLGLFALYRFGLWTGHYKRAERGALRAGERPSKLRLPLLLPDRAQLLQVMSPQGKTALLKCADEIVAGRVRLFGGGPVPIQLGFKTPLQHWTAYEINSKLLAPFFLRVPDIKFVWEPARFGWAFVLGRAYSVTKVGGTRPERTTRVRKPAAEEYATAFWEHLEQFIQANPPYQGPNWMNAQEVAIRLIALMWSAQVFADAASSTRRRRDRLTRSIAQHAARIPPTLVYARSQNNNHLLTEAAALYTAGVALGQDRWRELGWDWLNRALQQQISSYGEYIQHSTNYHRLMLQTALWADAIRRGRAEAWPQATLDALKRASHWLFSMLDPESGHTPNLGANDGAMILPLSSAAFSDHRPTVQAAARAFLRTSLPAGTWDEEALWLGLAPAAHTADSAAYAADHLRGRHSWAYLRASSFKSRLSHMDQLHFDLWWRGKNVAQDAGTYIYNLAAPWDNALASSRVHNTVTVDGREQMMRGGRFLTLDWFPAFSKNLLVQDHQALGSLLAHHEGYRRLGVRHERLAVVLEGDRWRIKDTLTLAKPVRHLFRLHWLLPDWPWTIENAGHGATIGLKSPRGWLQILLQTAPPLESSDLQISLVRAGRLVHGQRLSLPSEGWVSRMYGHKAPALSLAVEAASSTDLSFSTEFVFPA